jgi:hypothetical protein
MWVWDYADKSDKIKRIVIGYFPKLQNPYLAYDEDSFEKLEYRYKTTAAFWNYAEDIDENYDLITKLNELETELNLIKKQLK